MGIYGFRRRSFFEGKIYSRAICIRRQRRERATEQETSFFQFPLDFESTQTNWNQYSTRRKVSESIVSRYLPPDLPILHKLEVEQVSALERSVFTRNLLKSPAGGPTPTRRNFYRFLGSGLELFLLIFTSPCLA